MELSDMLELIDHAIAAQKVLSIERTEAIEPELLCIPIARSDDLLLVHVFYDFHPDGYRIICLDDIYDVIRDASEAFFERVIAAEGVYAKLKTPPFLDLTNWRTVLLSLKGRYDYCIIECDSEEDFLVGKLMEIREEEFTFWYFDATGRWDDELDVVDYDDVTAVSFDDNYTNTIVKYIPRP